MTFSFLKEKGWAWLQLIRFPNLFTAMADVVAGCLILFGPRFSLLDLLLLVLASACIYGGGCALNDLCDRDVDAEERPFRPIPSGRVSVGEALFLTCGLFVAALILSFRVATSSFLIASLLIALCVLYDVCSKKTEILGPLNMGACRAFNLFLGMSPGFPPSAIHLVFGLISLIYVFSLTTLSKVEAGGTLGNRRWIVLSGWLVVPSAVLYLVIGNHLPEGGGSMIFLIAFAFFTGRTLLKALANPTPDLVGNGVKTMVLGIPLLDAVYVAGTQSWVYGVPVALCIVPAVYFARRFYVT
jgi:4-hydroxybenzoate polyprenyltransferase